jgi:hypothetical protein
VRKGPKRAPTPAKFQLPCSPRTAIASWEGSRWAAEDRTPSGTTADGIRPGAERQRTSCWVLQWMVPRPRTKSLE